LIIIIWHPLGPKWVYLCLRQNLFMSTITCYRTLQSWLVLILFFVFAICFTSDPTPTIAEDTTDKTGERYLNLYNSALADNNNSDKNNQKNSDLKHFCPKCKSHSLTFEGLNTYKGEQIQLINCSACEYEWQETWILPNWFWIKSSSPNNHWTSERWNKE
jgi:DNA-directed RNA polymerase subunit M/transcription elongation factor TFIIS